jgi:hypothetical protein
MVDKTISTVYDVAKDMGANLSALSWNGFNLFGDKKSIDELERLLTLDAHVIALRQRLNDNSWAGHVDRQSGAFDEYESNRDTWR